MVSTTATVVVTGAKVVTGRVGGTVGRFTSVFAGTVGRVVGGYTTGVAGTVGSG